MPNVFKFAFLNYSKPLTVILEPSCDELPLAANSKLEIAMEYKELSQLVTDLTEKHFTVYLWQEGRTQIWIDNVEATPASLRE